MRFRVPGILVFCIAILILAGSATNAGEQPSRPREPSTDSRAEALRKQREKLELRIAELSKLDDADEASDAEPSRKTAAQIAVLRSTDAVYVQNLTRLEQLRRLEAQLKDADRELQALDQFAPDEPKPYSFLLLENFKDQLAVEEDREKSIESDKKSAEQLLKAAHTELDENAKAGSASSQKSVPAGKTEKESHRADTLDRLSDAELATLLARARIGLMQTEVESQALRLKLSQATQKQLSKKIEVVQKDTSFSAADRDKELQRIAASEAEFRRRRKETEAKLQDFQSEQKSALQKLTDDEAPQAVLDKAAEAWRVAADAYQTELVLLDQQIENVAEIRRSWRRRYELATARVEPDKLARWLDDLDEFLEQLQDTSHSLDSRRKAALQQQEAASHGLQGHGDPVANRWRDFQNARLQELRDLSDFNLNQIQATERSLGRFRRELKSKVESNTAGFGTGVAATVRALLAYQVVEVDDQKITVGRLLVLLAYITGGVLLAYSLSRLIGRRLLPQLGVHRGTAAALKSIVFYTMCVMFGVAAFKLLNIPLAAFAFLGGAAAIAVGFGSQDIMNNFMSGIILLVEQPIRIGDVVEVDDVQGVVLHIGLRSTRLQTEANHELIVPNKTLIDEEVTNLTLSDNFVQTFVAITVERTVSVRQAKFDMLKVAFLHPMVVKSPRPVVLLKEVDTYWMTFEVHFSVQYQSFMKCAAVQSEILEVISEMFKPADSETSVEPVATDEENRESDLNLTAPADSESAADLQKFGRAAIVKELKRARGALNLKA